MKLYRKVIHPYFKDYSKTHNRVNPECMDIFKGKWFDESLQFEITKCIAVQMGLTNIGIVEAVQKLTKEYHLAFENRYVEYISVPKQTGYRDAILENLDFVKKQERKVNHGVLFMDVCQ